ncbi:MAG: mechanosensitive ion channel family protein [Verrucomicrobia bacterium]|nr:mechanosensitive ion channel family protein [Verrucomicrobiota bacterium]MCH8528333.1 mechanosensitive ion channel family protein [Kiritimatiellia bacterium]
MLEWLENILPVNSAGLWDVVLARVLIGLGLFAVCALANWIAKRIIVRLIHKITRTTRVKWDETLSDRGVFIRLSHLVPGLILYHGAHLFDEPLTTLWLQRVALAYVGLCVAASLHALLNALQDIYRGFQAANVKPITGYVQSVQLVLWLGAVVYAVATLMGRSPAGFLTGLGALSAILMLVFKDTIMGLVAGVQLTANDMVRLGDWIEMPKYGADGDVIDITLHTVMVRNFDQTITTIPAHALIADSFKNWRGMHESGGRRIKRSLMVDMHTVKFCEPELLEKFAKVQVLKEYICERRKQIEAWNEENKVDQSCPLNGRRITNLGTFRAYITDYLKNHPAIHQTGMVFLVRQMEPTEKGVPLEIYVFTKDTRWPVYEGIQADIFDHLIAAASWFDLSLFQAPSGSDVRSRLQAEISGV